MSLPLFVSFINSEPMQRRQLAQLVNRGREGRRWVGEGGQKGEADREGSKGLTTRSLVFQVMDMHVLV